MPKVSVWRGERRDGMRALKASSAILTGPTFMTDVMFCLAAALAAAVYLAPPLRDREDR